MSLCAYCSLEMQSPGVLCVRHTNVFGEDWAAGNRIICDFVHRGIVPPTPSEPTGSAVEIIEWAA